MNAEAEVRCSPGNCDGRVRISRYRPLAAQLKPLPSQGTQRVASKKQFFYTAVKVGRESCVGPSKYLLNGNIKSVRLQTKKRKVTAECCSCQYLFH
jgi:hypothetical protein